MMNTASLKSTFAGAGIAVMLGACSTTALPPPPPTEPALAPTTATPLCADRNFPIYFASGETGLDSTAREAISVAIEEAGKCQLSAIEIIAQSDAIGSEAVNMSVSQERADAVLDALMDAELDVARIAIVAMGESNAITDDNLIKPMNRRVDVWFRE